MFKNLQIYRLPAPWPISLQHLDDRLARRPLVACGSQDIQQRGWGMPTPSSPPASTHLVGRQLLVAMEEEEKILPGAVVSQWAQAKAALIEQEQGYKPGRKQMKELREEAMRELLPRAFTRHRRMRAWIDRDNGWLVVDAPSPTRAETLLELLRQTLDEFPVSLLRTERAPGSAMADWLAAGEAPTGFTIDQDCELHASTEGGASVRYARHSLKGDEVKAHLAAGKRPTRLALTFEGRVSFILTAKGELKRLQFLDVVFETVEEAQTPEDLFDAHFALMTGELSRLIPALVEALGGELKG